MPFFYIHISSPRLFPFRTALGNGPECCFNVNMNFHYADYLDNRMIGDATLFQRADMAEAGWAANNNSP
ncbi:MAG: hypothetical protein DMG86_05730 [Acidobacteria bacterium]|nr:MAG: hypothetical protein DMG86_05730 [Acidobacteriota bacterium]